MARPLTESRLRQPRSPELQEWDRKFNDLVDSFPCLGTDPTSWAYALVMERYRIEKLALRRR